LIPPNRLTAAAREAVRRHWPHGRLVRVARAWAIVGRAVDPDEPRGWFSVLVSGIDKDCAGALRVWWTGASWGHRRRRDAVAAAELEVQR
jgi:hypothetical protein